MAARAQASTLQCGLISYVAILQELARLCRRRLEEIEERERKKKEKAEKVRVFLVVFE